MINFISHNDGTDQPETKLTAKEAIAIAEFKNAVFSGLGLPQRFEANSACEIVPEGTADAPPVDKDPFKESDWTSQTERALALRKFNEDLIAEAQAPEVFKKTVLAGLRW